MEQTFLKKINKASSAEASNHKKIRLILLILTIAGTLFSLTEYSCERYYAESIGEQVTEISFSSYFGIVLVFIAAYFGMFAVFGIFKDMVNKQTADVQMSLPMSAKERYCSKLLALAKLHLLPLLCSGIVLIVVGGVIAGYSGTLDLIRFYMVIFAQAFFTDATAIFCMCCCGALAEGVYTSLITMVCLSSTPIGVFITTMVTYSGLESYAENSMDIFSLVGVISMKWLPGFDDYGLTPEGWAYLAANILISCLLIAVTFMIYRRRDARSVGKPFVYEIFMEIFMFIGLFTLYMVFFAADIVFAGIVTTFIVYFVIRIVAARAKISFKVFLVWAGKFTASIAAFYVIALIAYFTGGFGFYKYFPDMSDIERAEIYISADYYEDKQDPHYSGAQYSVMREEHWFTAETDNKFDTQKNANYCHEIVKKYNDISDRSLSDFFNNMSYRSLHSRYWETRIEITIYGIKERTDSSGEACEQSYEVYNMYMYIPDGKDNYDEAVEYIRQYFNNESSDEW